MGAACSKSADLTLKQNPLLNAPKLKGNAFYDNLPEAVPTSQKKKETENKTNSKQDDPYKVTKLVEPLYGEDVHVYSSSFADGAPLLDDEKVAGGEYGGVFDLEGLLATKYEPVEEGNDNDKESMRSESSGTSGFGGHLYGVYYGSTAEDDAEKNEKSHESKSPIADNTADAYDGLPYGAYTITEFGQDNRYDGENDVAGRVPTGSVGSSQQQAVEPVVSASVVKDGENGVSDIDIDFDPEWSWNDQYQVCLRVCVFVRKRLFFRTRALVDLSWLKQWAVYLWIFLLTPPLPAFCYFRLCTRPSSSPCIGWPKESNSSTIS